MDEMGVIDKMRGVAVHDGWTPYRVYEVVHQLCNAHHLRELEAIAVNLDQDWARGLQDLLVKAKTSVDDARARGEEHLSAQVLHSLRVRYGQLIAQGHRANPAKGSGALVGHEKKAINLVERLDARRDDVLGFLTDFDVPWDNNQAERDIRMVKLQQKISGTWRTFAGAEVFCAIRSYISTMKKHNVSVIDGLGMLARGDVWLPGTVPRT
jgi:transposase